MPRKFNGTNQNLVTAGSLTLQGITKLSIACWFYVDSYAATDRLLFESSANFNNNAGAILCDIDSSVAGFSTFGPSRGDAANYNTVRFANPAAAQWHHFAANIDLGQWNTSSTLPCAATGIWIDGVSQTLAVQSGSTGAAPADLGNYSWFFMCRNAASLFLPGRLDEFAIWAKTTLLESEIRALALQRRPATEVRRDALLHYWTMDESTGGANSRLIDRAPRAVVMLATQGSVPNDQSNFHHPQPENPKLRLVRLGGAAGGGTTFPKSFAGSLTAAGALTLLVKKNLAGSITPAGALAKRVGKALAGAVTGSGAVALKTGKPLAGSAMPAGAVALKTSKGLAGSVTGHGALTNLTKKNLAGSVTPTGTLTAISVKLVSVGGSLTAAGAVALRAAKAFSGSSTPAGAAAAVVRKALAGSSTPHGTLTALRQAFVSPGGAVAAAGRLLLQTARALAGQVLPTGQLTLLSTGVPTITTPAFGWVASDNGLTYHSAGPRGFVKGESRRVWMDFGPLAELQAGDTIAGTPTLSDPGAGLLFAAPTVAGGRVYATLYGSPVPGAHRVTWQVQTAGGSVLSRSGWVEVPDLGTIHAATVGVHPVPTFPAVGWVASDDGLVYAAGGPHRMGPTEVRRFWMDFQAVAELQGGDAIVTAPLPTVSFAGGTGTAANVSVTGTKVYVDISGLTDLTEYRVIFTIQTTGGATVVRSGVLRCADL